MSWISQKLIKLKKELADANERILMAEKTVDAIKLENVYH